MIQEIALSNFTVFKDTTLHFGEKINVLVGENGSGKTHLLKALYAMVNTMRKVQGKDGSQFKRMHNKPNSDDLAEFRSVFNVNDNADLLNWNAIPESKIISGSALELSNNDFLKTKYLGNLECSLKLKMAKGKDTYDYLLQFKNQSSLVATLQEKKYYPIDVLAPCVFFPCRELLSIYPHYLSLRREFSLPYDSTYDDTIGKLGLPPRNNTKAMIYSIIHSLETAIHGTIFLKNEKFYYHENKTPDGLNWEIDMIAEGWRKLGMLLQLLQDGSLREGSILFWDEPEANLNPQLICLIAMVIVELSKLDIQVFLTTHSLFLVNELEIVLAQNKITDGVRFFNLQKDREPQQGNTLSALKNVMLLDEDMKQSDRYLAEEI